MTIPVQILGLSRDSVNFNLDPLFIVLKKIGNRPFVVYSINGNSRKGKSLMCNFFIQYLNNQSNSQWFQPTQSQNQFFWKGGMNRVTEGIFIWPEPFLVTNEQTGSETCIILMDTQGAFDELTSTHENAIIFAFSLLLSSVLIWNQPKDIADDTLQFFQMFLGFAKLAGNDSPDWETHKDTSVSQNLSEFQKLLFLIRDFAWATDYPLGYYDDDTLQEKNFKVDRLNPADRKAAEVNFRKSQILSSFESTGVFTLPHPGKRLTQSHELNNLDPDFFYCTKQFVNFLFSPDILRYTKKVGGVPVTGNNFGRYVHHWARYFTSPDIPRMQDIMRTTSEIQVKVALQSASEYFVSVMEEYFGAHSNGVEMSKLEYQLTQVTSVSYGIFTSMCKSVANNSPRNDSMFHEEIQLSKDHFGSLNLIRQRYAQSQKLLREEQANLQEVIRRSEEQLRLINEKSVRDQAEFDANFARIKAEGEEQLRLMKLAEEQRIQRLKQEMEAEARRIAAEAEMAKIQQEELIRQQQALEIQRQQELQRLHEHLQAQLQSGSRSRRRCVIQ